MFGGLCACVKQAKWLVVGDNGGLQGVVASSGEMLSTGWRKGRPMAFNKCVSRLQRDPGESGDDSDDDGCDDRQWTLRVVFPSASPE